MKKQIQKLVYILSTCDCWKSYSSMQLIGVFTKAKLLSVIKQTIESGNFNFNRDMADLDRLDIRDINISLEYGFIEPVIIDECRLGV